MIDFINWIIGLGLFAFGIFIIVIIVKYVVPWLQNIFQESRETL